MPAGNVSNHWTDWDGAETALDGSYDNFVVSFVSGDRIHRKIILDSVDMSWTTELGSPTQVSWYWTYDTTGDEIALPVKTSTIVAGQTAATGGVSETIDRVVYVDNTAGSLTLWIKFADGSTPTGVVSKLRVYYRLA